MYAWRQTLTMPLLNNNDWIKNPRPHLVDHWWKRNAEAQRFCKESKNPKHCEGLMKRAYIEGQMWYYTRTYRRKRDDFMRHGMNL